MRLIDADSLLQKVSKMIDYCKSDDKVNGLTALFQVGDSIIDCQTVDAVPVVHGRWIKDGDYVVCSECGEEHAWDEYRAIYCEDCGAKMDGGVDDG